MWFGTKSRIRREAVGLQRGAERLESCFATELGIEGGVIDDVIAVGAAAARPHEGRRIDMSDAERLQIRRDVGGLLEAEILRELQAVRGEGGRHHASPIAQNTDQAGSRSGACPPQIARPRNSA